MTYREWWINQPLKNRWLYRRVLKAVLADFPDVTAASLYESLRKDRI